MPALLRSLGLRHKTPEQVSLAKYLTTFYKFRHQDSDAGLNDLIAGALTKPLPQGLIKATLPQSCSSRHTASHRRPCLGVFKEDQRAHGWYFKFRHDDLSTVGLHCRNCVVN